MIIVDDLRFDGPYMADAPHYRSLLEGTEDAGTWHHFENAYSTYPICGASRSSFMFGLYSSTTNFGPNKMLDREYLPDYLDGWKTMPQSFSDAGRQTASIGKTFHGDSFPGEFEYDSRVMVEQDCPTNSYMWCDQSWWWDPPSGDEIIAETTIKVLEALDDAGTSFFLAVGFHKPHLIWEMFDEAWDRNYDVPSGVDSKYRVNPTNASYNLMESCMPGSDAAGEIPDVTSFWSIDAGVEVDMAEGSCTEGLPNLLVDSHIAELRRAYYSAFTHTDNMLGRVLNKAREYDWWDNTIVVTFADHGFALGENGHIAKVSLGKSLRGGHLLFPTSIIFNNICFETSRFLHPRLTTVCRCP